MQFIIVLCLSVACCTATPKWNVGSLVRNEVFPTFDHPNIQDIPSTNLSDVKFLLWTRSNAGDNEHYRLLPQNSTNLNESPFDPRLKTHVIFHGYEDFGKCEWILKAKSVLLDLYECNFISVDHQRLVPGPWFNLAVENSYRVGNYTAHLIDWIKSETSLDLSSIHIVGHSLGAQTAGFTGKYITSGQIARITGLDPAGPGFHTNDIEHRIDKSDAVYVDILHSNSGPFLEGCYGMSEPVGDADFYPNGGQHQPGCVKANETIIDDWLDLINNCSHARVTDLWVESISALSPDEMFTSWPCSDYQSFVEGKCPDCGNGCPHMGIYVETSLIGNFFLRTNGEPPYALGDQQQINTKMRSNFK